MTEATPPGAEPVLSNLTENPAWEEIPTKLTPSARVWSEMAYDAADGYVVMFGGYNRTTTAASNDTWSFAHGNWTLLHPRVAPSPRDGASMEYDPADGYVVLFGGWVVSGGSFAVTGQTWKFLHGNWSMLSPGVAPHARVDSAMTYDSSDGYLLLFGGVDAPWGTYAGATFYNDTWAFSQGQWRNVSPVHSPSVRVQCFLTYDANMSKVLLYGGQLVTVELSDTWTFSAGVWTELHPPVSPRPESTGSILYDPYSGVDVLFGGLDNYGSYNQTWVFSSANWSELKTPIAPGIRVAETFSVDAADGNLLLFGGGVSGGQLNDTWAWAGPFLRGTASPSNIDLGQSVVFAVNATSPSGSPKYAWNSSGSSIGCPASNLSYVTCTPAGTGRFAESVNVSDARGAWSVGELTVTVNTDPVAGTPRLSAGSADVGQVVVMTANGSGGTGNYSAFNWSGLPSPGCTGLSSSQVSCPMTHAGMFAISVRVTDTDGVTSPSGPSASLLVFPAVTTSAVTATATSLDAGQNVTFSTSAEWGSGVYGAYTWTNLSWASCAGLGSSVLTCRATTPGAYRVSVHAVDSLGELSAPSTSPLITVYPALTVLAVSTRPGLIDLGQPVVVGLSFTGGSPGDTFVWEGLPPGCAANDSSQLQCTPASAGSFTVSVTVEDSDNASVAGPQTALTVAGKLLLQQFVATPAPATVGANLSLTVLIGGGTPPYSYSYTGLPLGCATQNTDVLSCTPERSGSYAVGVTVNDSLGESVSRTVAVRVVSAPAPPTPASSAFPWEWALLGAAVAAGAASVALLAARRRRAPRLPSR